MMKKVIGYVRVSSEIQKRKNNSIPLQKKKIKEYCSLNDFELIDVYEDDGRPGTYIRRHGKAGVVYGYRWNDRRHTVSDVARRAD